MPRMQDFCSIKHGASEWCLLQRRVETPISLFLLFLQQLPVVLLSKLPCWFKAGSANTTKGPVLLIIFKRGGGPQSDLSSWLWYIKAVSHGLVARYHILNDMRGKVSCYDNLQSKLRFFHNTSSPSRNRDGEAIVRPAFGQSERCHCTRWEAWQGQRPRDAWPPGGQRAALALWHCYSGELSNMRSAGGQGWPRWTAWLMCHGEVAPWL